MHVGYRRRVASVTGIAGGGLVQAWEHVAHKSFRFDKPHRINDMQNVIDFASLCKSLMLKTCKSMTDTLVGCLAETDWYIIACIPRVLVAKDP